MQDSKAFIKADMYEGQIVFVATVWSPSERVFKALVYGEDDLSKKYTDFEKCEQVVYDYNYPPQARTMRWNNREGTWDILEYFNEGRGKGDREDFHADG